MEMKSLRMNAGESKVKLVRSDGRVKNAGNVQFRITR